MNNGGMDMWASYGMFPKSPGPIWTTLGVHRRSCVHMVALKRRNMQKTGPSKRGFQLMFLFVFFAWQPVRSREIGGRWFVQTAVMQLECADSPGPDSVDVGFFLSKKICNFFYFRAQEE